MLKLKVRKFLGLIPTFVEFTGEKLVGGTFLPTPSILNRVKVIQKRIEAVARRYSAIKGVLKSFSKFTEKYLCRSVFFNNVTYRPEASNFIKKETPTQVFPCEFCETFTNTFFYRTSPGNCFCPFLNNLKKEVK